MFDIATVGHFTIDFIKTPLEEMTKLTLGGPPTYVSLAARNLGAKVSVISNVGEDFPSIYLPWLTLKEKGVEIRCVELEGSRIPYNNIEKLVDEHTRAVAISSVQFKTGFRCDLERIHCGSAF